MVYTVLSAMHVSSFMPTKHQMMPESVAKALWLSTKQKAPFVEGKIAVWIVGSFCWHVTAINGYVEASFRPERLDGFVCVRRRWME